MMLQALTDPLTSLAMSAQLGREIKRMRTKAGMSGPVLAARAGVSPAWIRHLETGRIQKPGVDKLRAIADELGMDVTPMLAMTDQLGATVPPPKEIPLGGDMAAAIDRQTLAIKEQTAAIQSQTRALLAVLSAGLSPQDLARAMATAAAFGNDYERQVQSGTPHQENHPANSRG